MTLGWPWPILRQGQIWSPVRLNWKNCYKAIRLEKLFYGKAKFGRLCVWIGKTVTKQLDWKNLQQMTKLTEDLYFEKNLTPGGCLPLSPGYIHVCDHYFQAYFPLKPFGQSKPNFMWSPLWQREFKFCKNCLGHMTKMAAMPIYGKNL